MNQRTEIASLGEFGLIEHLTKNIDIKNSSTLLGVGDDGAVIDHFGRQTVVSSDLLIEGIHFDLSYTPLKHLGYKSVIVNLSDIYAMNAVPTQILLNIGFSNRFSLEALDEFYAGVYAACEAYNVDLIGGDTSTSQKGFIISVTAIGEVAPDSFVKRSSAQVNDLICVSGELGSAFLGLTLLEREKRIFEETGGRVFHTSGDETGDFYAGNDFIIRQATGTIEGRTFTKAITAQITPINLALETYS